MAEQKLKVGRLILSRGHLLPIPLVSVVPPQNCLEIRKMLCCVAFLALCLELSRSVSLVLLGSHTPNFCGLVFYEARLLHHNQHLSEDRKRALAVGISRCLGKP